MRKTVRYFLIYNEINIHPLLIITQAALPKRNESAVLAIQPHQADQPSDGMDSLKTSSTSATSGSGGGLWRTLLIWGAVVLIILILAAVAPICHYSRLRPFNFGVEAHAPSQMVQRLVGELKTFFNYYFFFFLIQTDLQEAPLSEKGLSKNWKNVVNFRSS